MFETLTTEGKKNPQRRTLRVKEKKKRIQAKKKKKKPHKSFQSDCKIFKCLPSQTMTHRMQQSVDNNTKQHGENVRYNV